MSYGKDTSSDSVIAEVPHSKQVFRVSQLQNADLDKYLEDIRMVRREESIGCVCVCVGRCL